MSTLLASWLVLVPLAAQKGPNPADVKPGLLGFSVFLALAAATVLLWLSFRKQLKRIDFEDTDAQGDDSAGSTTTQA